MTTNDVIYVLQKLEKNTMPIKLSELFKTSTKSTTKINHNALNQLKNKHAGMVQPFLLYIFTLYILV